MRKHLPYLYAFFILIGCTKPFELPNTTPNSSVIVVEGDILVGANTENTFTLSRLISFEQRDPTPESKALVEILSKDGLRWQVKETTNGIYKSTLSLPADKALCLRIQTTEGKIYQTAFQNPVVSPAIDSVTYKQDLTTGNLNLYVHTHDPNNNTRYYRWLYNETWERHAWFETYHDYVNGKIIERPLGDQIYACWKTATAPGIIIDNTASLTKDVISYKSINTIPFATEKLYVRYSILVRQIALQKEAYEFWNTLRKNTELTGSIFDPQPSQLATNISCTNDPSRTAVGYVSVSKIAEKRIFIMNSAMNRWPSKNPDDVCDAVEFPNAALAETFLKNFPTYTVAYIITQGGYGVAMKQCVDCRFSGGTIVKPLFW